MNAPEFKVPADLRKALAAKPKVHDLWKDLTPIARRDFVMWIESAKQEETRKRRVESVPSRLASGKRRPCCYAIVPMGIYKALETHPKAKAAWKDLTPMERRDFVAWLDEAKDGEMRTQRTGKICSMLTQGRRHP